MGVLVTCLGHWGVGGRLHLEDCGSVEVTWEWYVGVLKSNLERICVSSSYFERVVGCLSKCTSWVWGCLEVLGECMDVLMSHWEGMWVSYSRVRRKCGCPALTLECVWMS